jgi:hypothetical protein
MRLLLIAIVAGAVAILLGQFPRNHPVVQALHFNLPALGNNPASPPTTAAVAQQASTTRDRVAKPRIRRLKIARFGTAGATLLLHGTAPTAGKVIVRGSYGGLRWHTLATARAKRSYTVGVHLGRRGVLHLRVLYADGSRAVGSIRVV